MSSQWTDPRPMSPHLQVWRWHVTLAASISHRASGIALYAGSLILVVWLGALAAGPESFAAFEDILLSVFGRLVLFAITVAFAYHLANGVRHLFWDAGAGFEPSTANMTAWLSFAFAIVASAALWWAAYSL